MGNHRQCVLRVQNLTHRRTIDYRHYASLGKVAPLAHAKRTRPCATTNKASDTQFPEADPSHSTDTDGCKSLDAALADAADHRAKYRLVAMMEKIIDVVSHLNSKFVVLIPANTNHRCIDSAGYPD